MNGQAVKSLIDTGAFTSCVTFSLIKRLHLQDNIVKSFKHNHKLFTAIGTPMKVIGCIQLSLNFNGVIVPFDFYVLPDLYQDMIIGMNFLSDVKAHINFPLRILTLYDGLVSLNLVRSNDGLVRTTDAILIPPRCEAVFPVITPNRYNNKLSILEPSATSNNKHLALARSLAYPKNNRTVCKVLNPTNAHIFLKRNTTVAVIDNVSLDSVNVVNNEPAIMQTNDENLQSNINLEEQIEELEKKGIRLKRNNLSDDQFSRLVALIHKNIDLFAVDLSDLPGTDIIYHVIDTGAAQPVGYVKGRTASLRR